MSYSNHLKIMEELKQKGESYVVVVETRISQDPEFKKFLDSMKGFKPKNFLCASIQDSICLSQDIRNAQVFETEQEAGKEIMTRLSWIPKEFLSLYCFEIHQIKEFLK